MRHQVPYSSQTQSQGQELHRSSIVTFMILRLFMTTLGAIQELTKRVRNALVRPWFLGLQLNHFFTIPSQKATLFHKRSRSEEDNNLCHITRGRILLQTCCRSVLAYNQAIRKIVEELNPTIDFTTLLED